MRFAHEPGGDQREPRRQPHAPDPHTTPNARARSAHGANRTRPIRTRHTTHTPDPHPAHDARARSAHGAQRTRPIRTRRPPHAPDPHTTPNARARSAHGAQRTRPQRIHGPPCAMRPGFPLVTPGWCVRSRRSRLRRCMTFARCARFWERRTQSGAIRTQALGDSGNPGLRRCMTSARCARFWERRATPRSPPPHAPRAPRAPPAPSARPLRSLRPPRPPAALQPPCSAPCARSRTQPARYAAASRTTDFLKRTSRKPFCTIAKSTRTLANQWSHHRFVKTHFMQTILPPSIW